MKKYILAGVAGALGALIIMAGVFYSDIIIAFVQDKVSAPITLQNEEQLYYYSKLNEKEKKAYKKIVDKIEEYPGNIRIPYLKQEELENVFEAVSYDWPEIFCMGTSCRQIKKRNCYYFEMDYAYDKDTYVSYKEKLNKKVDEIVSLIDGNWSDYEKELFIHDYIVENCTYTNDKSVDTYKAYGALVNGKATCEGYSRAMQILLNRIGINNSLIIGTAVDVNGDLQGHMWNVAQIDGEYYYVDLTWDDPVGQDDYQPSHIYFNLTLEDISCNHYGLEDYDFKCDSVEQNYFVKNKLFFSDYDSNTLSVLKSELKQSIKNGEERIELRFSNEELMKKADHELFTEGDLYKIIGEVREELLNVKLGSSIIKITNEKYHVVMIILSYEG